MEGAELKAWRRAERERLIALRQALPPAERQRWGARIDTALRRRLIHPPLRFGPNVGANVEQVLPVV